MSALKGRQITATTTPTSIIALGGDANIPRSCIIDPGTATLYIGGSDLALTQNYFSITVPVSLDLVATDVWAAVTTGTATIQVLYTDKG